MDTMPDDDPMEIPSHTPLAGLDPADLLRQGVAEDTLVDDASRSFTPPLIEELAPLFPQFEILGLIGQGGMGAVYKVRQKDLDRIVALKILPPAIGQSPTFSSRFTREAKALAKLNHPGIVTIHEFGQRDGLYFFLMEFVDGVNLAQLLKTGRISPREALAIVPQICDALQFAHDQGIVHRDIKPENILLDRLGRVKVADFGIAKVVAAAGDAPIRSGDTPVTTDATLAGKVIGTPQYMAPEQIEHPSEVDHRADIYALGVVFYQMLTGELPDKDLQAPSKKVHIDVRLDEIVLQALEKNPELRFQQASVMKTRVDGLGNVPVVPLHPADVKYAGFWKRLLAFSIDYILVSIALFPFVVGIASIAPESVVVSVPFGLFTTERTLESNQTERKNADGSTTAVDHRIVEVTALGKWKYLYRDEIEHSAGNEEKSRQLIDPVSRKESHVMTAERLVVWILMIYWILMESSSSQASVGKMLVGIRVVDCHGRRIGIARAAGRNVSKLLSAVTLMIGFLMAGWTRKKQALHDIVSGCDVTISPMRTRVPAVVPGEAGRVAPATSAMKTRTTGRMIAIGCGVLGLIGMVLLTLVVGGFWLSMSKREATAREMLAAKRAEAIASAETQVRQGPPKVALSAGAVFSLASEWVLERSDPLGGYDMDSGRFIPFQPITGVSGPEGAPRWRQENGVDLLVDRDSQTPGILFGGFVGNRVDASMWEAPAEFVAQSAPPLSSSGVFDDRMTFMPAPAGSGNPDTILIRTQNGNAGLLQILEATDTRGVKLRYKLVQTERQVALSASISASSRMESPKLQFLAWQDEWRTSQPGAARHPDGSPVTDASELKWLRQVQPGGCDVTSLKLQPEPRFLHLWFSHPLFDQTSLNEVALLDDNGREIPLGARGNAASGSRGADELDGRLGWLTKTISPGAGANVPTVATVRLRYTIGPLERTQEVGAGQFTHIAMSLEGNSRLSGIGQNAEGNAFITLAVDAAEMRSRKFGVVAVTQDGRHLTTGGGWNGNSDGTGVRVEKYTFPVPLANVAKFIIGTRPVHTHEWKNVALPGHAKPVPGTGSQPLIESATPRDGVYFTYTGLMTTVLELRGGRFRYWFETDVKRPEEPEYPLSGIYRENTDTISLQNEKCSQPVWTFRTMDGHLTLWRPDALAIPEQDRHWDMMMLKRYGGGSILVASDKPAEELWERRGPPEMPESTEAPGIHGDARKLSFGPVVERVLNAAPETKENSAIDLDAGKLVSFPPDLTGDDAEKTKTWVAANGVDAYAAYEPQEASASGSEQREKMTYEQTGVHLPSGRLTGLGFYDAAVLADSNADWETTTPDRVASMMAQKSSRPWSYLPSKPGSSTTWLFKTREGGMGILQITGLTDNPRGVKIRYKLVQNKLPSADEPPETTSASSVLAEQPPVVVETFPLSGARDVQPGETEIRVRFSKAMAGKSWSWSTAWENSTPEFIGQPHFERDARTCVAKVRLEPGRTYAFWLNSEKFDNFRDRDGRAAVPYLLIFQTK